MGPIQQSFVGSLQHIAWNGRQTFTVTACKRELLTITAIILNTQALELALTELPGEQPSMAAGERVERLGKLVDGDLPLQLFLEQLLPELTELFSGSAAVAWLKAEGASGAVFGIRYRMDELLGSLSAQKKHERLVQLAWKQNQAMLAEPSSSKRKKDTDQVSASNTTGHQLLFGPINHLGEPIALLEVVLGDQKTALNQNQRQLYLRGIQLVAERVYGGLQRRMTLPAATLVRAEEQLGQLTTDVRSLQQQIVRTIEARLQGFHRWQFSSIKENQAFAKRVHQLLDSHGLRVVCSECGNPAILRCLRAGNAKHGAFVFDHYLETGRTFHGGQTSVPLIRVVGKPARRAALSNPA